ncbi:trigger factor [Niabella ginsengisoli]|uniref:Trigger factor n=1 Tax=Niabella ginsengisoli TaxID=522298 RepID=A0ABS9SE28_9BACT|nr:trigger factor [Niabella ginsengisoli]MCH5596609.1 trigger factor [Niabella ginsengisoli]
MATITKEPIGQLHEKISVKIDKADYLPSFEKSLKEYSKKASIQGFRPGKVPAGLIKKMYGPSLFTDEVLKSVDKELINHLQTEKAEIFAQPLPLDTDLAKLDINNPSDYTFDFEIGLKPEFELADLSKADITGYNIDITDEMINEEIDRLQNRYGNMTDKDVVDGSNNVLNVTFVEVDADGNEVADGLKKENSLLLSYFTEAIQKELNGKKVGDSINIVLADAFEDKELEFIAADLGLNKDEEADKKKAFKLNISKISELEKKELNEELFTQLYPEGDVKTEEEFRAKIKDQIFNYWASQSRNQIQDQIFHKLVDNTNIEFPEAFLRKWLVTQSAQEQGEQPAKTEEQIDTEMPTFLNQLKWTLISEKVVKDQGVEVKPEELRAFAQAQLFSYMGGMMPNDTEQPWVNDYIDRMMKDRKYVEDAYNRIQSEKVFEWAETQIKPTSKQVNAEEFTKMVNEHQHAHH